MSTTRILLIAVMLGAAAPAVAEPIVVIVNAANTQKLTAADVRNIYEDNVIAWASGQPVKAYHLPTKAAGRETFAQKVLDKSAAVSARFWANKKITNTARNPPDTTNELLVVDEVARDRNAIGYVPADLARGRDGVRVVLTLD